MLLFIGLQFFGHGLVFVYFLEGKKAADGFGFGGRILLVFVKITSAARCHDYIMPHPGCFNATFLSSPAHDPGARSQSTFQDFIPAQQLTPFGRNEFFHSPDGIALQLKFIFQIVVFDALLAFAAGFPVGFSRLISTNMDVGGGKNIHHFSDHILHKSESGIIAQAKFTLTFFGTNTAQVWICGNDLLRVAGHFNFWDDGDASFLRIGNQFLCLQLGIIPAVGIGFSFVYIIAVAVPPFLPAITGSPCRLSRQCGIFFYFNPPAGSIGKVHVQRIDFIETNQVNHFFDEGGRKEMP